MAAKNQLDVLAQAHRGGSAAIDRHKKSFRYAIYPTWQFDNPSSGASRPRLNDLPQLDMAPHSGEHAAVAGSKSHPPREQAVASRSAHRGRAVCIDKPTALCRHLIEMGVGIGTSD